MLDVSGIVRCVGVIQTSDVQLKTDVQPLGGVLDKLDQVRAVSFRWNEKAQSLGVKTDARQIGVLAQELEQVFPELVVTPEPTTVDKLLANYPEEMLTAEFRQRLQEDADKTQYKAVRYSELTAVLLEAVKELRRRIARWSSGFRPWRARSSRPQTAPLARHANSLVTGPPIPSGLVFAGIRRKS